MKTLNITLKIEANEVLNLEDVLRNRYEVISSRILPDTDKLYENSATFQKLVKEVKRVQRIRDEYINENN